MSTANKNTQKEGSSTANDSVLKAHTDADKDIAKDPDFQIHKKNNDLDEGELARAGGDKTDLT